MQKSLSSKIRNYVKLHIRDKRWKQVVAVLACVVVFCTTYALILPAVTMTNNTFCGKQEHVHSDACYEKVLVCGQSEPLEAESSVPASSEEAPAPVEASASEEPVQAETPSEDAVLPDGQDEVAPAVGASKRVLHAETTAPHVHTEACYEKRLICQEEEHEHTLQCHSDPNAVEAPSDWTAGLPTLTGDRAKDLVAVAESQLGYTESDANFLVTEDGAVKGYTRYGAWYAGGNGTDFSYADWCACFVSFCLNHAGVSSDEFPYAAGCTDWITLLTERGQYEQKSNYTPKPGDIVFIDTNEDETADHVGIVTEVDESAVKTIEGNRADAVGRGSYEPDGVEIVGYGVLPIVTPRRAASADEVLPEITVRTDPSTSHGEDTTTFYTGEAAITMLTISNPKSAQIEEDDGTVVRVYMQFEKTIPGEGHPKSADGAPSQAEGSYTVIATGSERKYQYTVTRIDGADDDHYTYCLEFQRPLQGNTISISLPSGYPSPSSAGGTNTVWGVVLTEDQKAALDEGREDGKPGIAHKPENGENTQIITWETKPDEFTLKKWQYNQNGSPCTIVADGKGGYYIERLQYIIRSDRDTTQTLEGKGKDYVESVTCVDSFTLPEGVRFEESFVKAIKDDTLSLWNSSVYYPDISYYGVGLRAYRDARAPGVIVAGGVNNQEGYYVTLSLSEDEKTLYIRWTAHNIDSQGQSLSGKQEIKDVNRIIQFLPNTLLIDTISGGQSFTFQNKVDYTFHYSWSGDRKKESSCDVTLSAGEARLRMDKRLSDNKVNFGAYTEYEIGLTNKGTLPYEKLCYVKDPLPDNIYLPASGMEKLFTDQDFGKGASVLITDATFCPDGEQHQTVTGMDGTTTGITAARNTSEDSNTKYSGCSGSDQHPEDHTGSIDIRWNEDHTQLKLTFTKADGSTSTRTCEASAAAIQDALDAENFLVTNFTRYTVQWDLRDENEKPATIYGGQRIALKINACAKDTFMRLEQDWPGSYPTESVYEKINTAYAYGAGMTEQQEKDQLALAWCDTYIRYREFYLSKGATLADGNAMTVEHVPKDGETVDYRLSVEHKNTGSYDILPLTDHMSGAQVLLAEVDKNKDAAWANDCEIFTAADGMQYYKISRAGTYSGVWLGDAYADSVSVTESASGRDTLIKWYFTNYTGNRTDTISYKAMVCPKELKTEGLTFSLGNESWLGDHQTHRLYAPIGEIRGAMLEFNKKIVPETDIQAENAAKVEGEDYCPVSDGQTVYYRFLFKATASEPEEGEQAQPATVTLTGSQLRDSLPLGLSKSGTDYLQWKKGSADAANAQPGDVWIVGYQNATDVQNQDSWYISQTGTENRQEIRWDGDFSVSFTSEKPLYVYVRLTFPEGAAWQEYAVQYSSTELVNTLYVDGVPDSVTHDLKTQAKAVLQKGVYNTGGQQWSERYGVSFEDKEKDSLFYYQNYDVLYRYVCYSVVLYNDGDTRLYINDMQDVLPRGFTFGGHCYYSPGSFDTRGDENPTGRGYTSTQMYYSPFYPNSGKEIQYKFLAIDTDVQTRDGVQLLTFHFEKDDSGSYASQTPKYDEKRGKFYLNPGEAISFAYLAFTHERQDTDDAAVNSIAMPYYDYTGGGLRVGNESFHRKNYGYGSGAYSSYTPNDGSCAVIDNTQAVASGRTGVSNDTQWLYSQVKQVRGEIKPGITKKLTAAVGTDGTVTDDPLAAHPSDTLRWSVTAANDGRYSLYDYVLTDTMQEPYLFDGKVSYMIYSADQKVYGKYDLFSISAPDDNGRANLTCYSGSGDTYKSFISVNGKSLEERVYGKGPNYSDQMIRFQFRLTQDEQTGRYTLSIRFPDKVCAIPAGGTGVLTLETKRTDNRLINTVFVNTCFITPMEQTWDNTTNKGNMTTLHDVFGEDNKPTVRNSAQVTTSYGYVTSALKSVEEKDNPENNVTCNANPNYIVLPNKESLFTYTLTVDAPDNKAMDQLILIDGLPQVNDHSCFQVDNPRYSEFDVAFADDPQVSVTVTREDKSVTTLTPNQYIVEFSSKTEFDKNDWNGSSEWDKNPSDASRSMRIRILDQDGKLIPAKSHVSVRFDGKIKGDAKPGQIAWNSFGYHYSVVDDVMELEAAPLKVGIMIPGIPELVKQVVDNSGARVAVKADKTFRFLLYTGASLKETDEAKLAELLTSNNRNAVYLELKVEAGKSASDVMQLANLKLCTYQNGAWVQTDEPWTWTSGASYTLVELPCDDPLYRFDSINRRTDADGYTFYYQNDQMLVLSAVNVLDVWSFTIRKTDAGDGSALTGAWFALYSPSPDDKLTDGDYNALKERPTQKPALTIEQNGKTWYLANVSQTRDVENKRGTLRWDGLLRDEYCYREIQAPMGYQLDDTVRTAKKTDLNHTVTITNTGNSVALPNTGGIGTFWFTMGGLLLLAAAGLMGYFLLRKRERGIDG